MDISHHSRKRSLPQLEDEFLRWESPDKRLKREIIELSSDSDDDLKILHVSHTKDAKENKKDAVTFEEELECVVCGTTSSPFHPLIVH